MAVIRGQDGTWHRPFKTLELAALQSLVDLEERLELDGLSDADRSERTGNAVPPDSATAIAVTMGKMLLLAWSGESFMLSAMPILVRPIGVAMSLDQSRRDLRGFTAPWPDRGKGRGAARRPGCGRLRPCLGRTRPRGGGGVD
jgi:hypothetical protein